MNDTQEPARPRMAHFDSAPERPQAPSPAHDFAEISNGAKAKVQQRGLRRAIAINAVQMAREHAGRGTEHFSQQEADVIMAVTELLDKVAGAL